jgi:hypothetical protein
MTECKHGTFRTATDGTMNILGHVTLKLTIQNIPCETTLHVVRGLNQEIILGCDWLTAHGGCIDFTDKTFYFQPKIRIKSKESVTIQPKMSMIIQGKCKDKNVVMPTGLNGEIKPSSRLKGIKINSIACTTFDNCVPIAITNTTEEPITIKNGIHMTDFNPFLTGECNKPLNIDSIQNQPTKDEKKEKHSVEFNLEKTKCDEEQLKILKDVLDKNHL